MKKFRKFLFKTHLFFKKGKKPYTLHSSADFAFKIHTQLWKRLIFELHKCPLVLIFFYWLSVYQLIIYQKYLWLFSQKTFLEWNCHLILCSVFFLHLIKKKKNHSIMSEWPLEKVKWKWIGHSLIIFFFRFNYVIVNPNDQMFISLLIFSVAWTCLLNWHCFFLFIHFVHFVGLLARTFGTFGCLVWRKWFCRYRKFLHGRWNNGNSWSRIGTM